MTTNARLTSVAQDYIDYLSSNCELDYDDFLDTQRNIFRQNVGHLSDCFTETGHWAEGEMFGQDELEAEIVRIVMDGQDW